MTYHSLEFEENIIQLSVFRIDHNHQTSFVQFYIFDIARPNWNLIVMILIKKRFSRRQDLWEKNLWNTCIYAVYTKNDQSKIVTMLCYLAFLIWLWIWSIQIILWDLDMFRTKCNTSVFPGTADFWKYAFNDSHRRQCLLQSKKTSWR